MLTDFYKNGAKSVAKSLRPSSASQEHHIASQHTSMERARRGDSENVKINQQIFQGGAEEAEMYQFLAKKKFGQTQLLRASKNGNSATFNAIPHLLAV